VTPNEVYELVDQRTERMMFWLVIVTVMVSAKLVAEMFRSAVEVMIWRRVIALLRETKILARIAQNEGRLNDRQTSRVESIVTQAQEVATKMAPSRAELEKHLTEEIRQVPEATAEKIKQKLGDSVVIQSKGAGT
jgi:hypothetical protein